MKVSFVGHASILINTQEVSILSDPWWEAPCFGAQWWNYPPSDLSIVDYKKTDYIYISHGHHDHYHPGTLKQFDRGTKILVSDKIKLAEGIRKLGFEVIEVSADKPLDLGKNITCYIWPTYSDDTLMIINDGNEICVNCNDALHSAPTFIQDKFIAQLKGQFNKIDYLFCGNGVASHFPNCYQIPGKDGYKTAENRQRYFNTMWTRIVAGISPSFAFPFAADVVLLEKDLFFANQPTHNSSNPAEYYKATYKESTSQILHIAPGFVIENGHVLVNTLRKAFDTDKVQKVLNAEIEKANRYGDVDQSYVNKLVELLENNISTCTDYLIEYSNDYTFGIAFKHSPLKLRIEKIDNVFTVSSGEYNDNDFDIVFTTRAAYLKQSLSTCYGREILFVGSGGIFTYKEKVNALINLHNEFKIIIALHDACPKSRFGKSSKNMFKLKKWIKLILRIQQKDLYDLKSWTVFK